MSFIDVEFCERFGFMAEKAFIFDMDGVIIDSEKLHSITKVQAIRSFGVEVREALRNNKDIESVSRTIELQSKVTTVGDTDEGKRIQEKITDLYSLLLAYENGTIKPQD